MGEGAKSSKEIPSEVHQACLNGNFWHSADNNAKLCTEGAVANMLFHMNLPDEAELFRTLVIKTDAEILLSLGLNHVPKRVHDPKKGMDPMEKCLWILETKFKCRRLTYLNPEQFKTASSVVSNLSKIDLPILISIMGRESVYRHVVVVFRGRIIDFETIAPYPLTVSNVECICGPKNPFKKLSRGYVICPSRTMKKSMQDTSDWGENTVRSKFPHLFSTKLL